MTTPKRILIAILCGLAGMSVLWTAAFVSAPGPAAAVFFWPGEQLLGTVGALLPDRIVAWLWPEGGLIAAAGLTSSIAIGCWWFAGAGAAYAWLRRGDRTH